MKLLKKTLAILLCLIMAVGIMPLSAVAKDDDVVKVDHVTVKTNSIFKVGEPLPKDFKADYTDHLFKLEDVDWSCTEVYNEWDYKSLGAFSNAGDTFEKGRGYELVLTFYSDQKEVDVKKFTLKTGDNTYTSYGTSSGVALRQSNVLYYHQPYTLAYFYIPFTELGHKVTTYDIQNGLLAEAITRSLRESGEFKPFRINGHSESIPFDCETLSADILLMEVSYAPSTSLEIRLNTAKELRENLSKCKTVMLCDENSAPDIAREVMLAKKDGRIDAFFFSSVTQSYLNAALCAL